MNIISIKYLLGVGISLVLFYLIKDRFRIIFLVFLSCVFIAGLGSLLLAYVLIYASFNYFIGQNIYNSKSKKIPYRIGLMVNLSQLIVLRYSVFAIDPLISIFTETKVSSLSQVIGTVGISYFTLQGIGYLTNIKMGWEQAETNFWAFLLYIVYFPKFISGPVERSNHFLPQARSAKPFNETELIAGFKIFLFGLFKKVAIANQLAPFVSGTYSNIHAADGTTLWLMIFIQPLYLYFDFSGYTDIAIGISRLFGIHLLPNFRLPFFAENMTTFWKRFHISLSQWFNDYIFRQTVFKRRKWGIFASVYAVFITFLLFGIWHGAGWNFMILGVLQAIAIVFEFFTKDIRTKVFSVFDSRIRAWIGRMFTYSFYGISLVFFFSGNIKDSMVYFGKLLSINNSVIEIIFKNIPLSVILFMFIILCLEWIRNDHETIFMKIDNLWNQRVLTIFRWVVYASVISILFVLTRNLHPFIYAQF